VPVSQKKRWLLLVLPLHLAFRDVAPVGTGFRASMPIVAGAGRASTPQWVDPQRHAPPLTRYRTFRSRTIRGEVAYLVYLPPDYQADHDRRYPVVYWLHGLGCGPAVGAVFVWRLDEAIKAGRVPAMIAILVNGLPASMYCDSADGRAPVESVIMADLIPHVDATYRTIARREGRAISGHSMGGFGALRLALKYPERFVAVSCLAAALYEDASGLARRRPEVFRDVFGGRSEAFEAQSPWTLLDRNADRIRGKMHIRLLIGERDRFFESNRRYHRWLERRGIPHEFHVFRNFEHDYAPFYLGLGERAFTFDAKAFAPVVGPHADADAVEAGAGTARVRDRGGKSKRGRSAARASSPCR
jgi:endo-1,4-beta-xylanase